MSALLLRSPAAQLRRTSRTYDRILKVARTIADLAGSEQIESATRGATCIIRHGGAEMTETLRNHSKLRRLITKEGEYISKVIQYDTLDRQF